MTARRIAVLAFDGVQALDVVGPHEVFSTANAVMRADAYDVRVVARNAGPVVSDSSLAIVATEWPDQRSSFDTVIVPGGSATRRLPPEAPEVAWLSAAAGRTRRLATVCTGAFIAARAGLLDGRRVATHWLYADRLQREHPELTVDSDPIFVRDGDVWTSAGVTAGIDLALALVEDDCGVEVAQNIARSLVMFLRRPGGQSQFAAPTWIERAASEPVREAQHLIDAAPGDDHRVPVLAARVGMSERHFTRVFARQVGMSPARYVERVRIDAARRLLEAEPATTEAVARRCGFGTGETLRRAFHRHLGVAPDDYRKRFGAHPSQPGTPGTPERSPQS